MVVFWPFLVNFPLSTWTFTKLRFRLSFCGAEWVSTSKKLWHKMQMGLLLIDGNPFISSIVVSHHWFPFWAFFLTFQCSMFGLYWRGRKSKYIYRYHYYNFGWFVFLFKYPYISYLPLWADVRHRQNLPTSLFSNHQISFPCIC